MKAGLIGMAAVVLVLSGAVLAPREAIRTNDTEFGQLLTGVPELTGTLLVNADLVLRTVTDRRDTVAALLADVNELAAAVAGLLSEYGPRFDTLPDQLHTITEQLGSREERRLAESTLR